MLLTNKQIRLSSMTNPIKNQVGLLCHMSNQSKILLVKSRGIKTIPPTVYWGNTSFSIVALSIW